MAPGRKRKSVRSDDVRETTATSPPLSQTTPTVGVTRAELDAAVSGLYQQMEAQNNLMLERLNALLGANRQPVNNEPNFADNVHDFEERDVPQRATGPVKDTPPQVGGSGQQPTFHERLSRQTSEKMADACPAEPLNDEEYFSGMVRQIMKESMQREEDEKNGGSRRARLHSLKGF